MSNSDRSEEKPEYEAEISEPEMEEEPEQAPRRQTKQKPRKKQTPEWAQAQAQHGTNIEPYNPQTAQEDHRDKVMKSRIKDRETTSDAKDSSLKIKIELDIEAEVNLYARVKGDITIGLL